MSTLSADQSGRGGDVDAAAEEEEVDESRVGPPVSSLESFESRGKAFGNDAGGEAESKGRIGEVKRAAAPSASISSLLSAGASVIDPNDDDADNDGGLLIPGVLDDDAEVLLSNLPFLFMILCILGIPCPAVIAKAISMHVFKS